MKWKIEKNCNGMFTLKISVNSTFSQTYQENDRRNIMNEEDISINSSDTNWMIKEFTNNSNSIHSELESKRLVHWTTQTTKTFTRRLMWKVPYLLKKQNSYSNTFQKRKLQMCLLINSTKHLKRKIPILQNVFKYIQEEKILSN